MEINLVSHDGGSECGDFAQTLDMTDIYSGWTETRAVKNKAHKWVFEAIYGYLSYTQIIFSQL